MVTICSTIILGSFGEFPTYRVTGQDGKNLPLTEFQQFWQLVGRYCSYLLPKQDGGTPKIYVNKRFLLS